MLQVVVSVLNDESSGLQGAMELIRGSIFEVNLHCDPAYPVDPAIACAKQIKFGSLDVDLEKVDPVDLVLGQQLSHTRRLRNVALKVRGSTQIPGIREHARLAADQDILNVNSCVNAMGRRQG